MTCMYMKACPQSMTLDMYMKRPILQIKCIHLMVKLVKDKIAWLYTKTRNRACHHVLYTCSLRCNLYMWHLECGVYTCLLEFNT